MGFDRDRLPDPASYFEAEGLKLMGPGKWKTTACPFHGGSDSLRINTTTGGWCCMACDAKGGDVLAFHMAAHGQEFIDAAKALGVWVEDGRPEPAHRPAPLPPRAALEVLSFESTLVAVAAGNVATGVQLTEDDRRRVLLAAGRITKLAEAYAP